MGYTQKLGLLAQSVFQDSSLNIGIGAAPSGTYKFEVTGTAKVSSTLLVSGASTFGDSVTISAGNSYANYALKVNNAAGAEKLRLDGNGNLLVGYTTDQGYKFGVNGTSIQSGAALFQSSVTAASFASNATSALVYSATNAATFYNIVTLNNLNTVATGINSLIAFEGAGTQSNRFGMVQNADGYGDFIFNTYGTGNVRSNKMVILGSSGNVGIGTSSPTTNLHVKGATTSVIYAVGSSNAYRAEIQVEGAGQFTGSFVANPSASSTYGGIPTSTIGITTSSTDFVFATSNTERMRIQSNGLLAFGEYSSTTTSYKFRFNGNGAGDVMAIVLNGGTSNSTSYISLRTGTGEGSYLGDIRYAGSTVTLNNISDIRFKENIIDAPSQWDKIKKSKLRIYDFKDGRATNQLGFIAQELYQTIPEAISKGGDDKEFNGDEKSIWTLASTNLIPTMFGALQEAMAKIEDLKSRLDKAGL